MDPFATLQIAPTLSLLEVKRAYYAQLTLHPPHKDAAAFRRIRAAYEALQSQSCLQAAYAAAPVDLQALWAEAQHANSSLQAEAGTRLRARASATHGAKDLTDRYGGLPWEEAQRLLMGLSRVPGETDATP